jgi:hypothetical protein
LTPSRTRQPRQMPPLRQRRADKRVARVGHRCSLPGPGRWCAAAVPRSGQLPELSARDSWLASGSWPSQRCRRR